MEFKLTDKMKFKIDNENITAYKSQPHNINDSLIDTVSDDTEPHIFQLKQSEQGSQEFENFFCFYLFTNQKNCSKIQSHIVALLSERFGCKADSYIGFMRQLWKRRFILNKHDVIVKLAELVLSPFIQEIPKNVNAPLSDKAKLLKKAIMQFEVTLIKDCDVSAVAKIWIEELADSADTEMMGKASDKYDLTTKGSGDFIPLEITKGLWYLNKVPLIVKYDEKEEKMIRAAIELLEMEKHKKKLVMVGHKSKEVLSNKWTIFECLYDLRIDSETESLYKKIIAAFNVSLQGRESINLEKFINSDTETDKVIEIKELFIMLEKDLPIGEKLPLPEVYIPRILSCDKRTNHLMNNPRSLSEYHTFKDKMIDPTFVNRTERSNISIDEDKAFSTFNDPVNIITGKPGIGKSTLMTLLTHQCPPDYWCVRINLINYSKFFSKKHSTEEVMNEFLKDEGTFFDKVKTTFRYNKRICLLLDGLDEIEANCVNTVLIFIKDISSNGIRVWITSGEHLKDKMSDYFKISPIVIEELTKKNQEMYIEQRLCNNSKGVNYTKDEAKEIITRLSKSVNVAYTAENILGVPLLLFIITEIFRKDKSNFKNIMKEDILVLTKMYKQFFNGKKEHQYKKAGIKIKKLNKIGIRFNHHFKQYELPALETSAPELFPKLEIDSKKISKSQTFLEKTQTEGDPLRIISKVVGENNKYRAIFSHQSFAAYFACVWLKKNKDKLVSIKDLFFKDNNNNLRLIFDIMLAENKSLHLAVLYKNPEQLKKYIGQHGEKDKGGRTALHLISSYSRNDSILRIDSNFKRIPENKKMYQLLMKKFNPFEEDELFKFNCLDYAVYHYSLLLLDILLETNENRIDDIYINILIRRFHGVNKIIGSCCLYGYFHLLKLMLLHTNSDVRTMKIEVDVADIKVFNQTTALHLAAANGNTDLIELLLKKGCKINEGNEDNDTPLHFACWFGTYEGVIKILGSGADLNAVNNMKQTPLHLASAHGKTEIIARIIELLLERGCEVNMVDVNDWSSLHYACRWGTCDAVIKILELGGDINAVTNEKQTPLHLASANGKTEIIELLLEKGCKINANDKYNWTSLHYACHIGTYDAVKKILELGGDINAFTNEKQTPLHLASANGKTDIFELLRKGSKFNVTDESNWTTEINNDVMTSNHQY